MTMETENLSQKETETDDTITLSNNKPSKPPPGQLAVEDLKRESDINENEDFVLGDTSNYSIAQRNELFQKGLDFEQDGKQNYALKCYLSCIKGLQSKTRFMLLPQCLKNIADIYNTKGEFVNAIHFAQAEKLFYETALIETQEIQRKIEEVTGSLNINDSITKDINDLNIQALRAEEYEHLAKMCMDRKQPELALEYAGKCAKIRQEVYGSDHVKTKESLDLFASLYAEVGKEQYSDSINSLGDIGSVLGTGEENVIPEVVHSNTNFQSGEPVSILRQRSVAGQKLERNGSVESDKEKKQVRFHESVDESIRRKHREEMVSLTITLVLLALCFLILISLGIWLYCSLEKGQTCSAFLTRVKSLLMTIRYNVNRLTSSTTASKTEYSR